MAEINKHSKIGMLHQLDLFRLPHTQGIVEKTRYVSLYTSSSDPNVSPLEFTIPESGQDFIDLSRCKLDITLCIELNKSAITSEHDVGPINILLQSLFSQVDMFMNHVRVTSSTTNYAYRAYIPLMLSTNAESKETFLSTQLFAKDSGTMDATNTAKGGTNTGLISRAQYLSEGKKLQLVGPLYTDISQSKRWLIPGVTTRISLYRNVDSFVLMSPQKHDFKVVIKQAKLIACYCTLFKEAYLANEAALSINPANYPLTNTVLKNYSLPGTETEKVFNDVFSGKIPEKVVIGFVRDDAYSGSFEKNPFNFQNFNAKFIGVYQNGEPVPGRAFEPKFNGTSELDTKYVDCYEALLRLTGGFSPVDITRTDFAEGYAFFCFDIEHNPNSEGMLSLYKTGNLSVEIKLKDSLTFTIQVIIVGTLPYVMKINKKREIILE